MTSREAKLILSGYRPGGRDAEDALFREALLQLQRDPELARWYAEERRLDVAIQKRLLADVRIPADLKDDLVALRKVVIPASWWRRPMTVLAAAAATLTVLLSLWFGASQRVPFAEFHSHVAAIAGGRVEPLDVATHDVVEVRQWLQARKAPADFVVPRGLAPHSSLGCRLLVWSDRKVSLICFQLEGRGMVHLFVTDREGFRFLPSRDPAVGTLTASGVHTLSWADSKHVYVLAGREDEGTLRELL